MERTAHPPLSSSDLLASPIYQDHLVKIYHGDSRELMPKLPRGLVVTDPPHIVNSSANGNVAKYYGVLHGDWREELRKGFAECFRVLKPNGTLIFKWNECSIPVREILALTPEKPLFGHKTGKLSKTHWVAFLKSI